MKCNNMGRGAKALAVSMALMLGVSACSRDYTLAYLYVPSATQGTSGVINAYGIDYQTGAIEPLADSPVPAGGRDPVGVAALPDGNGLFVINKLDSTVVAFNIGTDGKLYPAATYNVSSSGGTYPTAIAVDSQGKFLYIAYTYQNGFGPGSPGPGGVAMFPISEKTNPVAITLGTPVDYKVGNNPVGIAVGATSATQTNPYVYVVDQEPVSLPGGNGPNGTPFGVLRVFQEAPTTGLLTSVDTGKTCTVVTTATGYCAGTLPASVVVDPTGRFVYVADSSTNQIYGYTSPNGLIAPMQTGPYITGQLPKGMTIDPRGQFLFVANYNSSTVNGFTINAVSGALTATGTTTVATGPTCVTIENALGQYLFTSNYLDNSVSGELMNTHTGSLTAIQGTQFSAAALPTCGVAIANGSHAIAVTAY